MKAARKSTAKAKDSQVVHDNRVGIQIGGGDGRSAEVGACIMQILSAPHADEATKVAALQAFREVAKIENITISGANITSQ